MQPFWVLSDDAKMLQLLVVGLLFLTSMVMPIEIDLSTIRGFQWQAALRNASKSSIQRNLFKLRAVLIVFCKVSP